MVQKKHSLTATKLRLLLAASIILIFGLGVAGFIYLRGHIATFSEEVVAISTEAQASTTKVDDLKQTELKLEEYAEERSRTERVVAESKSYMYQNQIIEDITSYANQAGVGVTGFTFTDGNTLDSSTTPPPSPAATDPSATGDAPAVPQPVSAEPKSTTVVITFPEDVDYQGLLRFMSLIEQNLTKMQIAGISLTRPENKNPNRVSTPSVSLEVYIK